MSTVVTIDCKYLKGTVCELATLIAKKYGSDIDATTNQSACNKCVSLSCARMTNHVTYSLAYKSIAKSFNPTTKFIRDYTAISGVGTECESSTGKFTCGDNLQQIFSNIGFKYTKDCLCEDWTNRMNLYGPQWSLKFKKQIVDDIIREAKKRNVINIFVSVIPETIESIVGGMVDQACKS